MLPWLFVAALAGPLADRLEALEPELPVAEALAARVAIDQEARRAFHHGLPPEEEARIVEEMAAVDAANVAFLEQLLAEGWVRRSDHGAQASRDAWLLAQHADAHPDLQRQILTTMRTLLDEDEVAPKHVAYLHDRVAVNAGKPQRYGTQGMCGDTEWSPRELEDPEAVDSLRAELGLQPLADYAAGFDCDGRKAAAWAAYQAGEHTTCAERYAALGADRGDHGSWYNAACCAALAGSSDDAFAHLEAAWLAGYDDLAHVQVDTDLASLHDDPRWPRFVADHQPPVIVALDPRIELLHILGRLAGFAEYQSAPADHEALVAIDAWFAEHAEHDAVKALAELRRRRGLGYNALSAVGFLLDDADSPTLRVPLDPFPEEVDARLDHALVESFPEVLDAFVHDADWAGWREASADRRHAMERSARALFDEEDPQSWFDATFPETDPGRLYVVPEIIAWQNNYAGRLGAERYIVLGSVDWADDGSVASLGMVGIVVHEMAHSYAGAFLDAGAGKRLYKTSRRLFKRVRKPMSQLAYPSPSIMLDESLTRAITQLYLRDRRPDEVEADVDFNDAQSFYWAAELADALAPHRDADGVLDLDAAEADIEAVLSRWADAPDEAFRASRLTVNTVTSAPAIVVRPESLASHLDPLIGRFWADAEVRTPQQGPGADGPVVVYGSPADSELVASLFAARGLTLDAEGLTISDAVGVEGDDVRVIFAVEHEGRAWVVYSALDPARIEGIHALMHGPHGLTVGRGEEVVLQR